MKVFAIAKKESGVFYRIGETDDTSRWYTVTPAVQNVIKDIQKGDLVEIEYTDMPHGNRHLTSVIKTGSVPRDDYGNEYMKSRPPEQRAEIRSAAIGKMVAMSLQGIEGINIENYEETIKNLYKIYDEVI